MSAITVRNEGGRRVARRTEVISGQRIRDEGGRDFAKRSCQLKRKVLREGKVLHLGGGGHVRSGGKGERHVGKRAEVMSGQ